MHPPAASPVTAESAQGPTLPGTQPAVPDPSTNRRRRVDEGVPLGASASCIDRRSGEPSSTSLLRGGSLRAFLAFADGAADGAW